MANNSQSIKNQEKKKENRICEKIFRAFTSPFRTGRPIPTTKPSPNHHPIESVRVKFSETSTQAPKPITKIEPKKPMVTRVDMKVKTDESFNDYLNKAKLKIRVGDMMETSETETHDHHHHHHVPISHVSSERSDHFSDYIKKGKDEDQILFHHVPISHVSNERSDHFSEYIKKAKMKIRSSSTIARSNSTYDSFNIVKY